MKTRSVLLASALGLALVLGLVTVLSRGGAVRAASAQVTEGQFIQHVVKEGESLATIVKLYGASASAILSVNTIPDPNRIFPGQVIVIPVRASFTPSLTTPFFYTAQPGDTLAQVAQRFELDTNAITKANNTAFLIAGVTYLMPAGPHVYILKRGDTLGTVANRYGVTLDFILSGNSIPNPDLVFEGQPIFVPVILDAQPVPLTGVIPFTATPTSGPSPTRTRTATPGPTATGTLKPPTPAPPTATSTIAAPPGFFAIVVKEGESLVTYVIRFKVSAAAIIAANPDIQADPNKLFPGQVLFIPFNPTRTPSPTRTPVGTLALSPGGFLLITVQPGDTLLTYVNRYGVTASAILAVNPQLQANPDLLVPGQVITIPVTSAATVTPTPTSTVPTPTRTPTFGPSPTPVPSATPNLTPAPGGGLIQTIIREGETLLTFVNRYGVSASALLVTNPAIAVDPNKIFAGQVITIPVTISFTPSRSTPFFYVIQPGETAVTIARKFEMATETLTKANVGTLFNAGRTILVPAGPHVYTVRAGDELRFIAARYGVTVEFILRANSIPNPDLLFVGQQLFIPTQINAQPVPFD